MVKRIHTINMCKKKLYKQTKVPSVVGKTQTEDV